MAKKKTYKNKYKRKRFRYEGKYYDVYALTEDELLEKVVKKKKELEQGAQSIYNPTLNEYYKTFTQIRSKQIKESTIRAQVFQYRNIAEVELSNGIKFGDMRIKSITRRNIEQAREILLKNGKKAEHLNICFSHLNHVFNSALIDETIEKNPCRALKQLKRQSKPIRENRHRALSIEETKKFFEEATKRNSYYLNVFLLMIKTGMRVGELTALYNTDIDRQNGFIHVRRTISKDINGGYIVGNSAKTESGTRDIPLTSETLEIIKNQINLNYSIFGLEREGLLFKSYEGEILRDYTINREIKRICKSANIEYFTCHAFRNTFATRFIEQRPQDYKILSEILGHKDVSITLNLYTHVMTENKVLAMNEILVKTS